MSGWASPGLGHSWTATTSRTTAYTVSWTGASSGSTSTPAAASASVTCLSKNASYVFTVIAVYRGWKSSGRSTTSTAC